MGTGEQQTVRSFFTQDFAARGSVPFPTSVVSNPPESVFAYPLPSVDSQHIDAEHTSQPSTSAQSGITMDQVSTQSSQEDDPNASRRKRRKTEKLRSTEQDTNIQSGLSGWLGMELVPAATPKSNQTQAVAVPPRDLSSHPQPNEAASKPDSTNAQEGSKRKTMKLNANGRLLSSPPAKTPETTSAIRTTGKRGRPRKTESKLVIIKYTAAGKKNIGESINQILNGQMVYDAVPKRQNVLIPKPQPDKPTHPFFLKKQAQKETAPDEPQTQTSAQTSRSNTPASSRAGGTVPEREFRPFAVVSSVDRRTSKFSGSIEPIWPPQDLVHIRGLEQQAETVFERLENDRKKAKSAVISISDEENVLLVSTDHARKAAAQSLDDSGYTRPPLRFPGKHVASGCVLQAAIESQMSWSLPNSPSPSKANSSIRVIEKLRSALLSSVSAFDRGKYESQLWAHKYAPEMAEDVLQIGREARFLRDWLEKLKIIAVDTGKSSSDGSKMKSKREQKRRKRRKKADELDGFIVSSDEEASEMDNLPSSDDELAGDVTVSSQRAVVRSGDVNVSLHCGEKKVITNSILLSGPPGSGKTASVYAVAKELDFEVFEINSGSRRNARDMLERVGDMTQNHLVHLLNESEESNSRSQDLDRHDDAKQNKLNGFLKSSTSKHTKPVTESAQKSSAPSSEAKRAREQKQSLILLEEADILFEEDKQFWTGVLTLISQSRRPIVITCNDESLIPDMSLHAILRFQKPSRDLAIDYLLLVAANEGHVLKRDAVSKLHDASGMDIRRSLMDLNFWCQIGVGSEKAGLDWILSSWPPEANVDENGDRLRVLSLNTYEPYMGWFNRDALLETDPLSQETETLRNIFHWWRLGIADAEDAERLSDVEMVPRDKFRSHTKGHQLELLSHEADYLDMRSSLDILSSGCQMDMKKDVIDVSAPPQPESQRSNYIEAYPLLHADLRQEYSSLSETLSISFDALVSQVFRTKTENIEATTVGRIFKGWSQSAVRRHRFPSTLRDFQKVFEPVMRTKCSTLSSRPGLSFENGLAPITEDIAPYVRAIMVFDGRLEQYRDNLAAAWSKERGQDKKRGRATRASRAALEGGDKASTRKERWFPDDTNYLWVQNTGNLEWQQVLFEMGHFHVQPSVESVDDTGDTTSSEDRMGV